MKIGIFTDTYRPSVNGIVYVTDILRSNFEAMGHEVYVFAPAPSLNYKNDDPHIVRFPAVKGVFYEDYNTSLFFPPAVLKKIKDLDLDVFHFLTPGQVGVMGIYAAYKLDKPVVAEYCTDLFEYVEHYPFVLPGILALGAILPFTFKVSAEDIKKMIIATRPRLRVSKWNREIVKHLVTVVHAHCDAVIAHSRKSAIQLKSWQNSEQPYHIDIIPTGVDALPKATKAQVNEFKKQWKIAPQDEVVTFVGRLGAEKNLDMLIDMISELVKWRPNAKLMFVGDFDYRETLEANAKKSSAAKNIIFTGRIPREKLGKAFGASKVFVFPSLTDTQGLVIHEAALSGLPVVVVDSEVTEVVRDGQNGYFCDDDPLDMASKVSKILDNPELYKKMSLASKKIAKEYSEAKQAKQIVKIYKNIIATRKSVG